MAFHDQDPLIPIGGMRSIPVKGANFWLVEQMLLSFHCDPIGCQVAKGRMNELLVISITALFLAGMMWHDGKPHEQ